MAITIHVDIVSAERAIYSGLAEMLFAPAEEGEVGIGPGHAPFIAKMRPGEVRVKLNGSESLPYFISGGILEVQPNVVTVLADTAIRAADIDEAAALEAKRRAEEALENRTGEIDYTIAHAQLMEALQQLRTLEKYRIK